MATTYANRSIQPAAGSIVVASDGKDIGHVKEVQDGYLKVDVHWGRDYWLSFEEVLNADGEKTVLIIPSDEVNLYKRSKPHTIDGDHGDGSSTTDWLDREMMRR
ncbi:MAG: hypothetical protein WD557_08575 [Dehalococcoidia bacterium]